MLFLVQGKAFAQRTQLQNVSRLAYAETEGLALDQVMKGLAKSEPYFEGIVMPTFGDIPGLSSEVSLLCWHRLHFSRSLVELAYYYKQFEEIQRLTCMPKQEVLSIQDHYEQMGIILSHEEWYLPNYNLYAAPSVVIAEHRLQQFAQQAVHLLKTRGCAIQSLGGRAWKIDCPYLMSPRKHFIVSSPAEMVVTYEVLMAQTLLAVKPVLVKTEADVAALEAADTWFVEIRDGSIVPDGYYVWAT
ncbi:hypothetical protein [Kurthia massiliensis]|uniref:hypothetical protein n=1 Tax=Kurthia massiliensis TaxID=1033739 RepID=UPI00028988F6|nr:hypothetical protein [Kurthia massiliensis]